MRGSTRPRERSRPHGLTGSLGLPCALHSIFIFVPPVDFTSPAPCSDIRCEGGPPAGLGQATDLHARLAQRRRPQVAGGRQTGASGARLQSVFDAASHQRDWPPAGLRQTSERAGTADKCPKCAKTTVRHLPGHTSERGLIRSDLQVVGRCEGRLADSRDPRRLQHRHCDGKRSRTCSRRDWKAREGGASLPGGVRRQRQATEMSPSPRGSSKSRVCAALGTGIRAR